MDLLFHQAFPARFGRLALGLTRRFGWQRGFVVRHLPRCPPPTPGMLQRLRIIDLLAELLRLPYLFSSYREGYR
jgi:hypothetical protein